MEDRFRRWGRHPDNAISGLVFTVSRARFMDADEENHRTAARAFFLESHSRESLLGVSFSVSLSSEGWERTRIDDPDGCHEPGQGVSRMSFFLTLER